MAGKWHGHGNGNENGLDGLLQWEANLGQG